MYTTQQQKIKKSLFDKKNDFINIKDFVQTKINNPLLLERLREKQLLKIRIQKLKLKQTNLRQLIEKGSQRLQKEKKRNNQVMVYGRMQRQQFQKIQERTISLQGCINELKKQKIETSKIGGQKCQTISKNRRYQQIKVQLSNFKNLIEKSNDVILKLQMQKTAISQNVINLQCLIQQKCKTLNNQKADSQIYKEEVKIRKIKINEMVNKYDKIISSVKQKKKVKQALLSKRLQENIKSYDKSAFVKAQQACIKKLGKFVKELKSIIQNSKPLNQKRDLFKILMNVYCPSQSSQGQTSMSSQRCSDKTKHNSIETDISVSTNFRCSKDEEVLNDGEQKQQNVHKKQQTKQKKLKQQIPQFILKNLQALLKKQKVSQILNELNDKKSPSQTKIESPIKKDQNTQIINLQLSQKLIKIQQKQTQVDKQLQHLKQVHNKKRNQIQFIKTSTTKNSTKRNSAKRNSYEKL